MELDTATYSANGPGVFSAAGVAISDSNFDTLRPKNIMVKPLVDVPEPASALLLIAAMPWVLRRRR